MRRSLPFVLALCVLGASVVRADPSEWVGEMAPPIRARPLETDQEVGLEAYRGRVVVLAFVATWCGACRRIAPSLDALYEERRGDGLIILALSHEARGRVRAHVAEHEPAIPWLQCTGRTAVRYGADGLPTLVVIDRGGRVRAVYQGATGEIVERLRRVVGSLL